MTEHHVLKSKQIQQNEKDCRNNPVSRYDVTKKIADECYTVHSETDKV